MYLSFELKEEPTKENIRTILKQFFKEVDVDIETFLKEAMSVSKTRFYNESTMLKLG